MRSDLSIRTKSIWDSLRVFIALRCEDLALAALLGFVCAFGLFPDLLLTARTILAVVPAAACVAAQISRPVARLQIARPGFTLATAMVTEAVIGGIAGQSTFLSSEVAPVQLAILGRVSVVIPARYEEDYIVLTLRYLFEATPLSLLEEVIIVDDASDVPVEPLIAGNYSVGGQLAWLSDGQRRSIRVERLPARQGLIRAKIHGADVARGAFLFFLDGHCRPVPTYMQRMMGRMQDNYKRIVVPRIADLDGLTWEQKPAIGAKMMFAWDFSFNWFDDDPSDEVPVLSGGILLMSRRWWVEGGGYDAGMLEWGGENLEQSMRTWQCGGEIVVERSAVIGHIFFRPLPPDKAHPMQVTTNHARAAFVWLDDFLPFFLEAVPIAGYLDAGPGLANRMATRTSMRCEGFDWFVSRFRTVFEFHGLLLHEMHHLQHSASLLCLEAVDDGLDGGSRWRGLALRFCRPSSAAQRWGLIASGTRLINARYRQCLDRGVVPGAGPPPGLTRCDRGSESAEQLWSFSGSRKPSPRAPGLPARAIERGADGAQPSYRGLVFAGDTSAGDSRPATLRNARHVQCLEAGPTAGRGAPFECEVASSAQGRCFDLRLVPCVLEQEVPQATELSSWHWIW